MVERHYFRRSLNLGLLAEQALDEHFARFFDIRKPPKDKDGIDRYFARNDVLTPVQYKTDWVASGSGNAFVETISVDGDEGEFKPGWAYTGRPDTMVFYWVPGWGKGVRISIATIHSNLGEWSGSYDHKPAWNNGYKTWGITIPWEDFAETAGREWICEPPEWLLDARSEYLQMGRQSPSKYGKMT